MDEAFDQASLPACMNEGVAVPYRTYTKQELMRANVLLAFVEIVVLYRVPILYTQHSITLLTISKMIPF